MKSAHPFALSALGLISLAIHSPSTAQMMGPDPTLFPSLSVQIGQDANGNTRLSADLVNIGSSVVANALSLSGSVIARQQAVQVGSAVENASNAALVTTGTTLEAQATVNRQSASQSINPGESSVAVTVLDAVGAVTGVAATVFETLVGVGINAGGTLSGDTSVTISGNVIDAIARANDSTSALSASGANSGVIGNTAASPNNNQTFPTGSPQLIQGDLIATGVQVLEGQSNSRASIAGSNVGLFELTGSSTINAITGGVTLSNNRLGAVADGNRLSLGLTEDLSGTDVDSVVFGLQTVNDSGVSAEVSGSGIGVGVNSINDTVIALSGNRLEIAAAANRAQASVSARPDQATDSVVTDIEQFVRARDADVRISAFGVSAVIGRSGSSSDTVSTTISGNGLAAVAIGNDQLSTVALGNGVQAGPAQIEGNQNLLLEGSNLSISAAFEEGLIGTIAASDTLSRTTVSGNAALAQAIGNTAAQEALGFSGTREAPLVLSQQQRGGGDGLGNLELVASISGLNVGADAETFVAPLLVVADNQVAAVTTLNQQAQVVGPQSGSLNSTLTVTAEQLARNVVESTAAVTDLRIGLVNPVFSITGDPTRAAAEITVAGNGVEALAELNRLLQSLAGLGGSVNGDVQLTATQEASANVDARGPTTVAADLRGVALGLMPTLGSSINVADGRFVLGVNDNQLRTRAQANVAQSLLGPITGTVDVTGVSSELEQEAMGINVLATNQNIGLGIAGAGSNLFNAATDEVLIAVTDNRLDAVARQNSAAVVLEGLSGQLNGGNLFADTTQTAMGTLTNAANNEVSMGVTPSLSQSLNLGSAGERTSLTVSGNAALADAADNVATTFIGRIDGTIGDGIGGANVTALNSQSSTNSELLARNRFVRIGTGPHGGSTLASGAGGLEANVANNAVVTRATGNRNTAALAGGTGTLSANASLRVAAVQTVNSEIIANSDGNDIGIVGGVFGPAPGAGPVVLAVSGNAFATTAEGNDSQIDLGSQAMNIDGLLLAGSNQLVSGASEILASNATLNIGAVSLGFIGANPATLTVDGNEMLANVTANNSRILGSVTGSLAGDIVIQALQAVQVGPQGLTASNTDTTIGVSAGQLGPNASVAINNNQIRSDVSGNRVLNTLDSAALSSATGTLELSARQSLNGTNGSSPVDLNSLVDTATISVISAQAMLPAAAISNNQLVASTTANESTQLLNGLSGSFSGTDVAVALLDTQTTNDAALRARVSNSGIGAQFLNATQVPTALTVSGNAVLAQSVANSSVQQVSLNGVSTSGRPVTSLSSIQSLNNSSVSAEIVNVAVGFQSANPTTGPSTFSGAAVSSGNSLNATAVGNLSSLSRSGP